MIPKYQSHYSRRKNPKKVYLDCDITIVGLHRNYQQYCRENRIPIISADRFRRLFGSEFNIGFKLPKSDTCAKCDSLTIKLANCTDEEEKRLLTADRDKHLEKAQTGQDNIKKLAELAKKEPEKYHTIALDLQQALPTPKLTVGPAFYKRKLFTYNLGIHNCGTNQGYMMMWEESTAKRGSEEICSALLTYIERVNLQSDELHIITDNCRGQNKNWNLIALYECLVRNGKFKKVVHHYPEVGHTYLPCDRDFGRIESHVRRHHPNIYSPDHWATVIKEAGKAKSFEVHMLKQSDFVSIKPISDLIHKTASNDKTRKLRFADASAFIIDAEKPGYLTIKHSEEEESVFIRRSGRTRAFDSLPNKYTGPVNIQAAKLTDVKFLLQWIPPVYHSFYEKLIATEPSSDRVLLVDEIDREDESIDQD